MKKQKNSLPAGLSAVFPSFRGYLASPCSPIFSGDAALFLRDAAGNRLAALNRGKGKVSLTKIGKKLETEGRKPL
jgi:hypothetical protein